MQAKAELYESYNPYDGTSDPLPLIEEAKVYLQTLITDETFSNSQSEVSTPRGQASEAGSRPSSRTPRPRWAELDEIELDEVEFVADIADAADAPAAAAPVAAPAEAQIAEVPVPADAVDAQADAAEPTSSV